MHRLFSSKFNPLVAWLLTVACYGFIGASMFCYILLLIDTPISGEVVYGSFLGACAMAIVIIGGV